jgi:hypothetical protein
VCRDAGTGMRIGGGSLGMHEPVGNFRCRGIAGWERIRKGKG